MSIAALRQSLFERLFKPGRQLSGYLTFTLFKFLVPGNTRLYGVDAYIIYYPNGSSIPPHIDPVGIGAHHRVNVVLKAPDAGGQFVCAGATALLNRVFYFRPDTMLHEVTSCRGSRYILSFGWIIK